MTDMVMIVGAMVVTVNVVISTPFMGMCMSVLVGMDM
jgi:hypothetical protein